MYDLQQFSESNKECLIEFLSDYPFATVIGNDNQGNHVATQLPLIFEEKGDTVYLQGHLMKYTDHHKAFVESPQVLLLFCGPQAYVSSSWYSKHGRGSTWNYMTVHVRGKIQFLNDEDLVTLMRKFTLKFEKNNTKSHSVFDNLPIAYLEKMLPAIAGFKVKVDQMKGVFKLSQDLDIQSFANVIKHLTDQGGSSAMMATEMSRRLGCTE